MANTLGARGLAHPTASRNRWHRAHAAHGTRLERNDNVRYEIAKSLDNATEILGETKLEIQTEPHGVLVDIFRGDGALMAEGQSVVDMRDFDAGTYYVRAYNPAFGIAGGQTETVITNPADFNEDRSVDGTDLAIWQSGYGDTTEPELADGDANADNQVEGFDFLAWQQGFNSEAEVTVTQTDSPRIDVAFEINAPFRGESRPAYFDPDRDEIRGGDGSDTLIGNADLDRLFGGGGTDFFVGEGYELFDHDPSSEISSGPPATEASPTVKKNIDPVITIPDPNLRTVIAEQLGMLRDDGQLTRELLASDLSRLTILDASWRNIRDLSGLEFATNLQTLILTGNEIRSLGPIGPSRLTGGGQLLPEVTKRRLTGVDMHSLINLDEAFYPTRQGTVLGENLRFGTGSTSNQIIYRLPIKRPERAIGKAIFSLKVSRTKLTTDNDLRFLVSDGLTMLGGSLVDNNGGAIQYQVDWPDLNTSVGNGGITETIHRDGDLSPIDIEIVVEDGVAAITLANIAGQGTKTFFTEFDLAGDISFVIAAGSAGESYEFSNLEVDAEFFPANPDAASDLVGTDAGLAQLQHLVLDGNPITSSTGTDPFEPLELLSNLSFLSLDNLTGTSIDPLTTYSLDSLAGLEKLEHLSIDGLRLGLHTDSPDPSLPTEPPVNSQGQVLRNHILEFDRLPSEQGWSFGAAEGSSATETVFHIEDEDGDGQNELVFDGASHNLTYAYSLRDVVDETKPFVLEFDIRVIRSGSSRLDTAILVEDGNQRLVQLFFDESFISIGGALFDLDMARYRNLRVEYDPAGSYDVYADGQFVATGTKATIPYIANRLFIGDGTGATPNSNFALKSFAYRTHNFGNGFAPIANLPSLSHLSATDNLITDVTPLASLPDVQHIDLNNNRVSSIDALLGQSIIDNGEPGYSELTFNGPNDWNGGTNPNAFEGDYRLAPGQLANEVGASFSFGNLVNGELYQIYATWPEHSSRTHAAEFYGPGMVSQSDGSEFESVNQRFAPSGDIFGGRPWQLIGTLQADETGFFSMELTNFGDGNLAADAVRLERVVLPHLTTLDLRENPLDNAALEYVIDELTSNRPGEDVRTTEFVEYGPLVDDSQTAHLEGVWFTENLPPEFNWRNAPTLPTAEAGETTFLPLQRRPANFSGAGAKFDGVDDRIVVGELPGVDFSSGLTMEAWIYPTGPGNGFEGGNGLAAGQFVGGIVMNKEGEFQIARASDGEIIFVIDASNTNWIRSGLYAAEFSWSHVALSWDSDNDQATIYLKDSDGLVQTFSLPQATQGNGLSDFLPQLNEVQIGGRQRTDLVHHFDGLIRDVRLWNTEVAANAIDASLEGDETGLIGSWRLDETSGSVTFDYSPNGFHASLGGGIADSAPGLERGVRANYS